MSEEKFSLKWNDFESNISSAFKELRSASDLFDCTLSCGARKVQAHKLILSACSNFFRNVFKENIHQHPLIYLRGVSHSDLVSALDFMYHGEVAVCQDDLNSFLSLAEDLEIRGLTQNSGHQSGPQSQSRQQAPPVKVRRTPGSSQNYEEVMEIKTESVGCGGAALSTEAESYTEMYEEQEPSYYEGQETEEGSYQGLDPSQDVVASHASAIGGGKYCCTLCPFNARDKYNMRRHLETKHDLTAGYQCNLCQLLFKAKHHLTVHKGRGCDGSNPTLH